MRMSTRPAYPSVPAHPSFPALEHEVLDFWAADGTFEASVDARPAGENGANEYVFYDGPPFANGLPHYGHLLTGYVKDVVPRYRTMRGRRVERRFGWDTHGLPAEVEAEHQLGIKHKSEIEEMGVAEFNDACRASVLRYTDEWRAYVTARPAGSTSTTTTRRSTWTTWKASCGPSRPCGTRASCTGLPGALVLLALRDAAVVHRDQDGRRLHGPAGPGRHRRLRLPAPGTDLDGAYALVWTTTPWTLPSNLAVAVHPDVEYVLVETADTTAQPEACSSSPRPASAPTPASWATTRASAPPHRRRAARHGVHAALRLLRGPRERPPGARRRLRHHGRRHRARAHRAGLR